MFRWLHVGCFGTTWLHYTLDGMNCGILWMKVGPVFNEKLCCAPDLHVRMSQMVHRTGELQTYLYKPMQVCLGYNCIVYVWHIITMEFQVVYYNNTTKIAQYTTWITTLYINTSCQLSIIGLNFCVVIDLEIETIGKHFLCA